MAETKLTQILKEHFDKYSHGPKESKSSARHSDRHWRKLRKWVASISSTGFKY